MERAGISASVAGRILYVEAGACSMMAVWFVLFVAQGSLLKQLSGGETFVGIRPPIDVTSRGRSTVRRSRRDYWGKGRAS